MSGAPVTVPAEASAEEAARKMAKHRVCRLPVTEQGRMVGMVSQGDFAAADTGSGEAYKAYLAAGRSDAF